MRTVLALSLLAATCSTILADDGNDLPAVIDRDAQLVNMIEELRREVAALRQEVQALRNATLRNANRRTTSPNSQQSERGDEPRDRRTRDTQPTRDRNTQDRNVRSRETGDRTGVRRERGDGSRNQVRDRDVPSRRDGGADAPRSRRAGDGHRTNPSNDQATRRAIQIFDTYDKNDDLRVDFEEWLAMREGRMTNERREQEKPRFAEPAGDDRIITQDEFVRWMQRRSRDKARRDRTRSESSRGDRASDRRESDER